MGIEFPMVSCFQSFCTGTPPLPGIGLFHRAIGGRPEVHHHHHHHHHDCGSNESSQQNCGCDSEKDVTGKFSITGDPHIKGKLKYDGECVKFNYTTEGGNGEVVNLFDTDNLDITGKFDTLDRSDGNTYVTEETVEFGCNKLEIDADDDSVKLNGREIEDGTYCCGGNKVTKDGDKVTIETADGQKITICDKGDYLDTKVKLDDFESSQMGGMVGDAISGNVNDNADDYAVDESCGCDGAEQSENAPEQSENNCDQEQDSNWAVQLLNALAGMIKSSNPELSEFLTALANFMENSQGGIASSAAA